MNRSRGIGFACLFAALLFWAGNAIVGRSAPHAGIPPLALTFWRWVVAGALLAPLGVPRAVRLWPAIRHRWWVFAVYGLCAVGCFNTFLYVGLQYTTAVQASLIQSLLPVFVVLLAKLFLGQGIRPAQAVGLCLSLGGAALIVGRGDLGTLRSLRLNPGDLWMLAAVSVWAIQTIVLRWKPAEVDLVAFQTVAIGVGLLLLLPLSLMERAGGRNMPVTAESVAFIAYAALLASVVALSCWNYGTLLLGPHTAGFVGNLYPLLTSLLAVVLLGEPFLWFHGVGGGLILSGIYLATGRPGGRRRPLG